ncbi:MAG: hypothetical protein EOQ42_12480 [Mesorhizobium sp.]|nr:MAG: hypothetical protein EOQ42_12480 [Mesorhizobium sp.]
MVVVVEVPLVEVPLVVWASESPDDTASMTDARRMRFIVVLLFRMRGMRWQTNSETDGVFPEKFNFLQPPPNSQLSLRLKARD